MKKLTIIVPALAIVLGGSVLFASTQVSAHGMGQAHDDLVQKIAETFGKSEEEVQAIFDANRDERRAQMETNFEARLDEAVAQGEITEAQKSLILEKHAEMEAERDTFRDEHQDLTLEERQALREEKQAEIEAWAEANSIDLNYLMGPAMGREGRGQGNGMHTGQGRMGRGQFGSQVAQPAI